MLNEKEKEETRNEARMILESFGKTLESVEDVDLKDDSKDDGYREEGEGVKGGLEFRKRMFENAPKENGDCLIAEKGKW
jgi:hypothetical protein